MNTVKSASYLDLHLEIENFDKRFDFDFPFVSLPLLCGNIPEATLTVLQFLLVKNRNLTDRPVYYTKRIKVLVCCILFTIILLNIL